MVDRKLEREIGRLVEESVPPAPWLDDRVMVAVIEAARPTTERRRRPARISFALTSIAALIMGLVVIGVLVGPRLALLAHPGHSTHLGPSRDPSVMRFRALVDADMRGVDLDYQRSWTCATRDGCATDLVQVKAATEALLVDIAAAPTPAAIAPAAQQVTGAARDFVDQLDMAIAVVRQPNSDYRVGAAIPTVYDLDVAVAAVDCWPLIPTGGHSGFGCK